jgi:hypothetical protein
MEPLVPVILVGLPLAWLVAFAAYAYLDAPTHGMNPRKWAVIAFAVPLFGFFAYLFERSERHTDPADDDFTRGAVFEVHDSRRGEPALGPSANSRRTDDQGDGDETADRAATNEESADDEWNDPPGVDL